MSIGKKEIRLLIILGLILYAYLFYQFVLTKSFPEISDVEKKITVAKEQKARLDEDIKNKEVKLIDLKAKSVAYEKMDGYLAESADVTDTIEYIEKLNRLIGNGLTNVVISLPKEVKLSEGSKGSNSQSTQKTDKATSGGKYYDFSCAFEANLTYNEIINLLSFIEGSTKRVSVSKFTMAPEDAEKGNIKSTPTPTPKTLPNQTPLPIDQKYKISMTIDLYSINISNNDFGSSRLSKYLQNGWVIAEQSAAGQTVAGQTVGQTALTDALQKVSQSGTDISILETSVMTAGDNLSIYGADVTKDKLTVKTAGKIDVKLKLDGNNYTIETTRVSTGKKNLMRSSLPSKEEINVKVVVDLVDINENKDIALNLIVSNNTTKKINIILSDNMGRVKITDRSGSVIIKKNDRERIQIL